MTASLDVVKRFYDRLSAGDLDEVRRLFAPDIAWTEAERFPYFGGTWRTFDAVLEHLFVPIGRDWDGFAATPEQFVVQDGHVVAFGTYFGLAKRSGGRLAAPFAHLWTVTDRRITAFVQYTDTAKVLEAMNGPSQVAAL